MIVEDWDEFPNFDAIEFRCPENGQSLMQHSTLEKLQALRFIYNKPIRIAYNGGYRSVKNKVGSAYSAHRQGYAVDLLTPPAHYYELLRLAQKVGFTGIGIESNLYGRRLHFDNAPATEARPRPWIWTYA